MRSSMMASLIGIIITSILLIIRFDGVGEPEPSEPAEVESTLVASVSKSVVDLVFDGIEGLFRDSSAEQAKAVLEAHRQEAAAGAGPADDGEPIVSCVFGEQTQFLRQGDCRVRGGRFSD